MASIPVYSQCFCNDEQTGCLGCPNSFKTRLITNKANQVCLLWWNG